jgi:activator of HSP90 ATPase
MCRTVHQEIDFAVPPKRVYDALLDSKTHAKMTDAPAKVSRKVGAAFTAGGDYITGYNLSLTPGKKIVQAWRGNDWPKGEFSIVSFELRARGKGSRLIFDQRGIPEDAKGGVTAEAWTQFYWAPMREFFDAQKG